MSSKITIEDIYPRLILDSRGNPTVEVDMQLSDGSRHRASVPSGASTGSNEALELRDTDDMSRYRGKGVLQALVNIDVLITPNLVGIDPVDQTLVDDILRKIDGTANKGGGPFSKVGANAILAVSIAALKAGAYVKKVPLYKHIANILKEEYKVFFTPNLAFPTPMFNVINGGAHAGNNLAIQEFMVVPIGISDIREKIRAGAEVLYALKDVLKEKGLSTGVGDEGGFAPNLDSDDDAIEIILLAIKRAGYDYDTQIKIGLDVAASRYYDEERGMYNFPHQRVGSAVEEIKGTFKEMVERYIYLTEKYPIISIEDGLWENDWQGFATLKPVMEVKGGLCVGDDLTVSNPVRTVDAIKKGSINAIIIKPNQVGQISLVFDVIKYCKENDIKIIVSHRSGETADTFISHLAVGAQAMFLKSGAPQRIERVEKYNELLRMLEPELIEKSLNTRK